MADSIGFPLPVLVKGFACMTGGDIELARKGIDPAHPEQVSGGTGRNPGEVDPEQISRARQQASEQATKILGYGPRSVRTGNVAAGTVFSTDA